MRVTRTDFGLVLSSGDLEGNLAQERVATASSGGMFWGRRFRLETGKQVAGLPGGVGSVSCSLAA